jgi:hypothetical protein
MSIIDDRGRVFGRINLIDVLVLLFLVALVPIAYTAFTLFRTPAPRITAVEPANVPVGTEMRVKVKGTGLRSLFRANIGEMPASAYLFESERSADVLFSNVQPGKYDLALYDGVQEVARLKGAVTVLPPAAPPMTHVRLLGAFVELDAARAQQLATGQRFPSSGPAATEILAIGKPRVDERWIKTVDATIATPVSGITQVPTLIRTECQVVETGQCQIAGVSVGTRASVAVPGTNGQLHIVIDEVRPDVEPQPADVTLRVVAQPSLADAIKVGDTDDAGGVDRGYAAAVTAVLNKHAVAGQRAVRLAESSGDLIVEANTPDQFVSADVVLHLGLDPMAGGWRYRAQSIRVGAPFLFVTGAYTVRGSIQSVTLRTPASAAKGR